MNTNYRTFHQYRTSHYAPAHNQGCCNGGSQSSYGNSTLGRFDAFRPSYSNNAGLYGPRQFSGNGGCSFRQASPGWANGNSCGGAGPTGGAWGVARSCRGSRSSRAQRRQGRINRGLTRSFFRDGRANPTGNNAVERLAGDKGRSTLVDLLGKNDLVGAVQDLEKKGPVTVLAPSNKAFADLAKKDPALFAKLTDPRNKKALQDVLLYHVSNKQTDFAQGGTFDSLLPQDGARFSGSPFGGTLINGDQQIRAGRATLSANGSVVIPVDQVLIPPGFDPSKLV